MRWIFWPLLAAMTGIYLTMLLWSLPHLSTMAGGLTMFDLRPGGYSLDEARAVLSALGSEGREFYSEIQQPLDTAFPSLMAIVLSLSLIWLFPRVLALVLSAFAVAGAVFDYLENSVVAVMLSVGPDGLSEAMVTAASRWTVLKSGAVGVVQIALLIGLVLAGWRKWQNIEAQKPRH